MNRPFLSPIQVRLIITYGSSDERRFTVDPVVALMIPRMSKLENVTYKAA